jgi:LmbE family N-acetylglucosaminyl deacetylase
MTLQNYRNILTVFAHPDDETLAAGATISKLSRLGAVVHIAVATRPVVNSHIPILCGEVPSSTGYLRPVQWEPNLYVEVTEEELDAKIKAMQSYKGEARPDPHPRSPEVLKALAKVRGSESGYLFAEAFMIQRIFG